MRPLLLLLLALVPACTTTRTAQERARQIIPVVVDNDLTSRSDVTVRVVATDGAIRVLGGVSPGQIARLTFEDRIFTGQYRLTAETGDGRTIQSRRFTLFAGAAIVWSLQRNDLQVVTASTLDDPGADRIGGQP